MRSSPEPSPRAAHTHYPDAAGINVRLPGTHGLP